MMLPLICSLSKHSVSEKLTNSQTSIVKTIQNIQSKFDEAFKNEISTFAPVIIHIINLLNQYRKFEEIAAKLSISSNLNQKGI